MVNATRSPNRSPVEKLREYVGRDSRMSRNHRTVSRTAAALTSRQPFVTPRLSYHAGRFRRHCRRKHAALPNAPPPGYCSMSLGGGSGSETPSPGVRPPTGRRRRRGTRSAAQCGGR
eukprot:ctg_4318.g492